MEYLALLILLLLLIILLVKYFIRRTIVFEHERALRYRNGKFQRVLEPGAYTYIPFFSTITRLDVRPRGLVLQGQEILSADNISVKINLAAQYSVVDPYRAVHASQSYHEALYLALQLELRQIVGTHPIDELLSNRALISEALRSAVEPQAEALGLALVSAQVKDITFPGDLKRVFAQVLQARQEGLAALEKARGESAALRNLANAARMLDHNPSLLQLRALIAVGESSGNTIVFNVPNTLPAAPGPETHTS